MSATYADLRDWVLALPGTKETFVDRWGEYALRAGEKIVVIGGPESAFATVKATLPDQAELVTDDAYEPASHVGRYGWVRVSLAKADVATLRRVVEDAWRSTAPKKVVRAYDSAQGQPH